MSTMWGPVAFLFIVPGYVVAGSFEGACGAHDHWNVDAGSVSRAYLADTSVRSLDLGRK